MIRIVEKTTNDGIASLLGKQIQVWCLNYIYTGTLVGVNDADIALSGASVVYETGPLAEDGFKDAQPIGEGKELFVRLSAVESYCLA